MKHPKREIALVADRYVLGKLSDERRRAFEAHFLECAPCLEAVETSRGLADAWRGLGQEAIAEAMSPAENPFPAAVSSPGRKETGGSGIL